LFIAADVKPPVINQVYVSSARFSEHWPGWLAGWAWTGLASRSKWVNILGGMMVRAAG